jgi:hypothetical protein
MSNIACRKCHQRIASCVCPKPKDKDAGAHPSPNAREAALRIEYAQAPYSAPELERDAHIVARALLSP